MDRSVVHGSTFGKNNLAMAAGIATLQTEISQLESDLPNPLPEIPEFMSNLVFLDNSKISDSDILDKCSPVV